MCRCSINLSCCSDQCECIQAKRSELICIALYDGVIDNTELSPFASSRVRANSRHYSAMTSIDKKQQKSSYSSLSPISMQKTFVLPQAVTCLQQTVTARGITNKHLLISLQNGQIFSVDLRQIHPRRPLTEPSPAGTAINSHLYLSFLIKYFYYLNLLLQKKWRVCRDTPPSSSFIHMKPSLIITLFPVEYPTFCRRHHYLNQAA